MYENLAKELKKNIQIVESTFEANNLQILNLTVKPYGEDDADCNILLEIASINGSTIPDSVRIKINLYDENDELYLIEEHCIFDHNFSGYDSFVINCYNDSKTLQEVVKGRLFVVKN